MTNAIDQQAHWDERYATDGFVFGDAPNLFLARQRPLLAPGMSALAVADGEGRNGVWLAEQGLDVLAVDISPVAIDKARRLAADRGASLTFQQVDLLQWDWPREAFDLVVAIFIQVVGPADRDRIFAGMKRAVRPGGHILLQGYRPEQLGYGTGGPKALENLYTEPMLRNAFADFEIVTLESHDPILEEGARHSGKSAVIDLVARKLS